MDPNEYDDVEPQEIAAEQWWLTAFNRHLVWARLRVMDSGVAHVFDSTGATLTYESEDIARSALMDAEFRALEGMDDDDAEQFGVLLEDLLPPEGEHDDDLVAQMVRALPESN